MTETPKDHEPPPGTAGGPPAGRKGRPGGPADANRLEAAERRAAELARANDALQAVTDALATAGGLDEIVPTVLRIAADTFGVDTAGYYDVADDLVVRLRYWLTGGEVLDPAQLLAVDPADWHAAPRRLAAGFTVSRAYLGGESTVGRRRAVVIDHAAGTDEPDFDAWLCDTRCAMELNVPCHAGGGARGAICLYRPSGHLFTDAEVALAEALAKQLALAVQADRLAAEAREAAVAREREAAAQARAEELARANEALRRTAERLSTLDRVDHLLAEVLRSAAEATGADGAAIFRLDAAGQTARIAAHLTGGATDELTDPELAAFDRPLPLVGEFGTAARQMMAAGQAWWSYSADDPREHPDARAWHAARGHRITLRYGLRAGGQPLGWLGLAFRSADPPDPARLEMVAALANQASLALHLGGLAEQARQVAVAKERQAAAEARANELSRANNALQAAVDALSLGTTEPVLPAALRTTAAAFGTTHAGYYDHPDDVTARPRYWLFDGRMHTPDDLPADGTAPGDPAVSLWDGITVPPEYFGESLRDRARVRVMDHYAGTALPDIDRLAVANGWGMELNIPLVADGRCDGSLVVYRATPYTPDEVALAETLGKQLSLAVRLDRLADARRAAAVAQERAGAAQDRADRLAAANATLKRCADETARAAPDADTVLGRVLAVLSEHLGSPSAALWLADAGDFALRQAYLGGEVVPARPDTDARLAGHWGRGRRLALRRHVDERRPVLYGPADIAALPAAAREFFARLGVRSLLGVPLLRGDAVVGCLTARFSDVRAFDCDDLELIQAVAHQGTLAVELTRLAEAAREAAVAGEQKAAAEARAAELARLNAALREGVTAVAGSADFRQSLAEIVLRVARTAGAQVAHLFLYDPTTNSLDSNLNVRDGRIHFDRDPNGPAVLQGPFDADVTPAFRQIVATQDLFFAEDHAALPDSIRDGSWPGVIDWHLARGHRSSCAIPVLAGDRPLGVIGLAWTGAVAFTPEEREVLLALSNHAALVIQLWRLEQAAREAAVAGERNRLAGEIHDTLAQGFAGVLTQLAAADGAAENPVATRDHLALARDLARRSLAEARRSVHALRPLPLAARDLPAALSALGRRPGGGPVAVRVEGPPRPLPPVVESELYRVAQEAVANADRHAAARRIDVTLAFDADRVVLVVRDDGRGFDPAAVPAGHGLVGMQERMDRAGGRVTIVSEPGRGTEVVAVVPTGGGT